MLCLSQRHFSYEHPELLDHEEEMDKDSSPPNDEDLAHSTTQADPPTKNESVVVVS
jgi:hypothetical protein